MGQLDQGTDVHVNHLELAGAVGLGEGANRAEASIVHQACELEARGLDLRKDRLRRLRLSQIRGDDGDRHALPGPQLCRERLQPVPPPRHQHEVALVLRGQLGQLTADAGRGARDECRVSVGCHALLPPLAYWAMACARRSSIQASQASRPSPFVQLVCTTVIPG